MLSRDEFSRAVTFHVAAKLIGISMGLKMELTQREADFGSKWESRDGGRRGKRTKEEIAQSASTKNNA